MEYYAETNLLGKRVKNQSATSGFLEGMLNVKVYSTSCGLVKILSCTFFMSFLDIKKRRMSTCNDFI